MLGLLSAFGGAHSLLRDFFPPRLFTSDLSHIVSLPFNFMFWCVLEKEGERETALFDDLPPVSSTTDLGMIVVSIFSLLVFKSYGLYF